MHAMIRHWREQHWREQPLRSRRAESPHPAPAAAHRRAGAFRETPRGTRLRWLVRCCLLVPLILTFAAPAPAQYFGHRALRDSGLIPTEAAERYGLKRDWYTRAEVDRSRGRLSSMTPHVSSSQAHTVFEVTYPDGSLEFSERQLDPFGRPVGVDGAKKLAEEKIAELKQAQIEAKLVTHVVPEISLYVVSDRALVQSLDGETGRSRWSVRVGKRDYPTTQAAANDQFVAVLNGTTLYVLDAEDGRLEWQRDVTNVPGAGPAVTDEFVFAPMINGAVEAYYLNDYLRAPYIFSSHGRAMVQPTVTASSVAWPTDVGHVYVGRANEPGIRYRLEANRTIVSRVASREPNRLVITSVDGFVYCLHEISGNILWRFSIGEPISTQAVAIGDDLYVVSDHGGLFCLNMETGLDEWWSPGIHGFVSASEDRVYALGRTGRIEILDRKTGGRIGSLPAEGLNFKMLNPLTDRMYVGNDHGMIQCLREMKHTWPVLHVSAAEPEKEKKPEVQQRGLDQTPPPVQQQPRDPFAAPPAGNDPFGGGAPAGNDPFGGGAPAGNDPFGGGGAGAPAGNDPFGGGAPAGNDPFGGGGADANPFD